MHSLQLGSIRTLQWTDDDQPAAKGKAEAVLLLLRNSDQHRYGKLVQELANIFNKGWDCYPVSLTDPYELMLHDDRGYTTTERLSTGILVLLSTW